MATLRPSAAQQHPIGSQEWILGEIRQATQYVSQEVEEFAFSAHNEMEWLNEHMIDIFSRNQLDVAEVFKTPGKLRGKTPRTNRKRIPTEARAPLSDVFTFNDRIAPSPSFNANFNKVAQFQVAEDQEHEKIPEINKTRYSHGRGKENIDSGYHEMTDDEAVSNSHDQHAAYNASVNEKPQKTRQLQQKLQQPSSSGAHQEHVSDHAVVSSENIQCSKIVPPCMTRDDTVLDTVVDIDADQNRQDLIEPNSAALMGEEMKKLTNYASIPAESNTALEAALNEAQCRSLHNVDSNIEDDRSLSGSPSPARPIIRKSSLTFAALPARAPLTAKKPIESTLSRKSNLGHSQSHQTGTEDPFRFTTEKTVPVERIVEDSKTGSQSFAGQSISHTLDGRSTNAAGNQKSSTQRLHERITMLGNLNASRSSKSIPSSVAALAASAQDRGPKVPPKDSITVPSTSFEDNDDDWIGPMNKPTTSKTSRQPPSQQADIKAFRLPGAYPQPHESTNRRISDPKAPANAESAHTLEAGAAVKVANKAEIEQAALAIDVAPYPLPNPTMTDSTTPAGSPVQRRQVDGPLGNSKAKFYSVLKSAKSIFASSAGTSAQAKIEVLSPSPNRPKLATSSAAVAFSYKSDPDHNSAPVSSPKPVLLTSTVENPHPAERPREVAMEEYDGVGAAHKVLDSSMNWKNGEGEDRQHAMETDKAMHGGLPKGNSRTVAKATGHAKASRDPDGAHPLRENGNSKQCPPPPLAKDTQILNSTKHAEARRPTKTAKDLSSKLKPAPVSIRVASQRIGHVAPSNATLSASLQDSLAAPAPPKRPSVIKKGSNSSLQTASSTQSFKSTATTAFSSLKALEAAARKKELDERETQRKAEQKRDLERRRAAKQEEERRVAQEQKAAEQRRIMEARNAAQRQAAEQRKAEAVRKNEQQRNRAIAQRRPVDDHEAMGQNDQPHQPGNHGGGESGLSRPFVRTQTGEASNQHEFLHINPAKPPKRVFQPDAGDERTNIAPAHTSFLPNAQNPAKRRRTSEEQTKDVPTRPTMAPPIRVSTKRKDTVGKQNQGYSNTLSTHGGPSYQRTTVVNQHAKTPYVNEMAKFSHARIPFAETPNPSHSIPQQQQQQSIKQPGLKTIKPVQQKSSPQYPNGDSIDLPEIATDSEDSDDENRDFVAPDWADSPALRDLLRSQQLIDPLNVFGPIAPLQMEEVFKGSKDRHARFRARTSSANWNGPDRLTEEERRRDREARERLEKDGGWTYRGSA